MYPAHVAQRGGSRNARPPSTCTRFAFRPRTAERPATLAACTTDNPSSSSPSKPVSQPALHDLPVAHAPAVAEQLHRAMQAPLTEGLSRSHTKPSERWNELDFALPMYQSNGRFRVDALRRAFEAPLGPGLDPSWREALDRLDFLPVHGFLVGSIDLVFRHRDRWYLADYKSNRLGPRRADYAPDRLLRPMVDALYPLQYHLYSVALLRLLRARIPGFDVERDFGGVFYLFVRGMDPAHPGHGVFFDRPPAELLERLDRAVGGAP